MMKPHEIEAWCAQFRKESGGAFQVNLWIPEPPPARDFELEKQQREFLATWRPTVPPEAGDAALPDFEAQCKVILSETPRVIFSIMGLYPPPFVSKLKSRKILWFATATTVAEAKAAEESGVKRCYRTGYGGWGAPGSIRGGVSRSKDGRLTALAPRSLTR